jgi:hypothetical protein
MEQCESQTTMLPGPYWVAVLYNYLAMAYYQLAAISRFQTDAESDDQLKKLLKDEAVRFAYRGIQYADNGLAWHKRILQTPWTESGKDWPEETYITQSDTLRDPSKRQDDDLLWYRTACRAVLAYYGQTDLEEVRREIIHLKSVSPPEDQPEEDPTMLWILTSKVRDH